jgi:hypothetical protein
MSDVVFPSTGLERSMARPDHPPTAQETSPQNGRNRLEIIRFESRDACLRAIRALRDCGMLNFTSYSEDEWLVYTPVAMKLRERGVPFEWLTEHV